MNHLDVISEGISSGNHDLVVKVTGRYYTNINVAKNLAKDVISLVDFTDKRPIKIIDPFAGDGPPSC